MVSGAQNHVCLVGTNTRASFQGRKSLPFIRSSKTFITHRSSRTIRGGFVNLWLFPSSLLSYHLTVFLVLHSVSLGNDKQV